MIKVEEQENSTIILLVPHIVVVEEVGLRVVEGMVEEREVLMIVTLHMAEEELEDLGEDLEEVEMICWLHLLVKEEEHREEVLREKEEVEVDLEDR